MNLIMLSFITAIFALGDWDSMHRIQRRVLGRICLGGFALSLVFWLFSWPCTVRMIF